MTASRRSMRSDRTRSSAASRATRCSSWPPSRARFAPTTACWRWSPSARSRTSPRRRSCSCPGVPARWRRARSAAGGARGGVARAAPPPRRGAGRARGTRIGSRHAPPVRLAPLRNARDASLRPPANVRFSMAERRYDPQEIEPRWQAVWADERTWEVDNQSAADGRTAPRTGAHGAGGMPRPGGRAENSYVLEMLPYPSGEPHVGHLKNYAVGDAVAHFRRRRGERVLHPMGYDAFGLPAENNAIKTGIHPRVATRASIDSYRRQFRRWGISIDWSREFGTQEPS